MLSSRKRFMEAAMDVPLPPPEMRVSVNIPQSRNTPLPSFRDYVKQTPDTGGTGRFLQKAADYIKRNEGVKNTLYRDSYGHWTIGIGHLVTPQELPKFKGRVLSEKEIMDIFSRDLNSKLQAAKRQFGSVFDTFSENLKIVILDGYFRGDMPKSPNTIALLKQRKFKQAANEYLNNNEFRAALKPASNAKGVAKRMQLNANIIFAEPQAG